MQPGQYRIRLSCDLCRAIVLPSVSLWVALKFLGIHLGPILFLPAYLAFLVLWAVVKRTLVNLRHARTAQQLGAQPIRRVVGKWPGNIDILLRMVKAFKTSYVLDVYLQLFDEYQCTTLNTRILWVNHVSTPAYRRRILLTVSKVITMDQQHSKFALSTGFGTYRPQPPRCLLNEVL
jgi:hypothetical protein